MNAISTIDVAFGLIAIVVGLCCHGARSAIVGALIVALLCLGVIVTLTNPGSLQGSAVVGYLVGSVIGTGLMALLGYAIRRGLAARGNSAGSA